jgi:hypothetical protein
MNCLRRMDVPYKHTFEKEVNHGFEPKQKPCSATKRLSDVLQRVISGRVFHEACPLFPRKRTSLGASGMSAWCQKRTFVNSIDDSTEGREANDPSHNKGLFVSAIVMSAFRPKSEIKQAPCSSSDQFCEPAAELGRFET